MSKHKWWNDRIHVTLVRDRELQHPMSEDDRRELAKPSKPALNFMAEERRSMTKEDPVEGSDAVFWVKHVTVDQYRLQQLYLARHLTPREVYDAFCAEYLRKTGEKLTQEKALEGSSYGQRTELGR